VRGTPALPFQLPARGGRRPELSVGMPCRAMEASAQPCGGTDAIELDGARFSTPGAMGKILNSSNGWQAPRHRRRPDPVRKSRIQAISDPFFLQALRDAAGKAIPSVIATGFWPPRIWHAGG
jgi:hypothetical protein